MRSLRPSSQDPDLGYRTGGFDTLMFMTDPVFTTTPSSDSIPY